MGPSAFSTMQFPPPFSAPALPASRCMQTVKSGVALPETAQILATVIDMLVAQILVYLTLKWHTGNMKVKLRYLRPFLPRDAMLARY